jgi:hypothetical protein
MDRRKDGSRDPKRRSSERSRSSQENIKTAKPSPPPTFLTSFPSFSPPDMSRTKRKASTPHQSPPPETRGESGQDAVTPTAKQHSRAVLSPVTSKKVSSGGNTTVGASAVNRTVQAAVNLRKTIMDTIVSRQSSQSNPAPRIFSGSDDGAGDPLIGASEEHVQRIINSSGGPIATVRKYSADLAESNERVATERNGKIRLVEENRQLRAQLQDKAQEIEELLQRLDVAKQLFERYVSKPQSLVLSKPTIQIIDSPSGPYALEDSSGTILATLSDDFLFPESSPMDTPDSVSVTDSHIEDIVQRGKCKYHLKMSILVS